MKQIHCNVYMTTQTDSHTLPDILTVPPPHISTTFPDKTFPNIVDCFGIFFALWVDSVREVLARCSRQLLVIAYSEANLG